MIRISAIVLAAALVAGSAFAGTTTVDFTQGLTGLAQLGGSGSLAVNGSCEAEFTGTPTYMVANSGGSSPAASSGTVSITMGVTPASDVTLSGDLGLIVLDNDSGSFATALVNDSGLVTLSNSDDTRTDTVQFVAPAASNAEFTLSYNTGTSTATVTVAGASSTASMNNLFLLGGGSVQIGVISFGGGKFRSFSATGSGIPDLDSTGTCGGEGEGEGEGSGEGEGEGEGEEVPDLTILGGGFIEDGDALRLEIQGDPGFVSYQWRKDGVDLGGETNAELVRDPVNIGDAGEYDVVVDTGSKAIVTSPATVVTVVASGALPVGGPIALMLLCGAMAVAARRKR